MGGWLPPALHPVALVPEPSSNPLLTTRFDCPELTGIGAKARQEILLDVLDPNRSVEGTYRAWLVKTKKEVLSGRLAAETQTSIELIDTTGKTHEISRDEIEVLKASDLSVMPEGFENLPAEDLSSLLEYLATSRVKH